MENASVLLNHVYLTIDFLMERIAKQFKKIKHNLNAYLITLHQKIMQSFARYAILDISSTIVNA
jgi:hypothetical protein